MTKARQRLQSDRIATSFQKESNERQRALQDVNFAFSLASEWIHTEFGSSSAEYDTERICCLLLYLALVRQATMRHWCRPCCIEIDLKWQSVAVESLNCLLLKSGGTSRRNSTGQKWVKTDLPVNRVEAKVAETLLASRCGHTQL